MMRSQKKAATMKLKRKETITVKTKLTKMIMHALPMKNVVIKTLLAIAAFAVFSNHSAAYDFNGDGQPDYLLYNGNTRQTAIWYLSRTSFVRGSYGPSLPESWCLVAVGDFNADGKPDYVLVNVNTLQTAIWYLNNNAFVSGVLGPTLLFNWGVVGVADFN